MTFLTRTVSGIRNFSLFTKKDITAYCEGGRLNVAAIDAISGTSNLGAEDVTFYEAVTSKCAPGRTFHLKAVGNCHAVHAIADLIIANDIKSVCVFVDRDWRDFDGSKKVDTRIVYTPHYAWENIVTRSEIIAEAALSLGHLPRSHYKSVLNISQNYLAELHHAIRWPLYLDITGIGSGVAFLDKSERCGGAIKLSANGNLTVDRGVLKTRFSRERGKYVKNVHVDKQIIKTTRYVPGHILMGASICITQSYLKKHGIRSPDKASVRSVILQHFSQSFSSADWQYEFSYFKNALLSLPIK